MNKSSVRNLAIVVALLALTAATRAAGFTNTFDAGPLDADWSQDGVWSAGPAGYNGGGAALATAAGGGWTLGAGNGPKCDFNSAEKAEIASLIGAGNGQVSFDIVVDGTSFDAYAQWWQINIAGNSASGWKQNEKLVDSYQNAGDASLRIYHIVTNFTAVGWTNASSTYYQIFFGGNSDATNALHYCIDNLAVFHSGESTNTKTPPDTNVVTYTSSTFVHPGALDSKGELDYVKAQITVNAQPWTTEFNNMKNSQFATRGPNGLASINSNGADAQTSEYDSIAAYTQSLLWYFTGNATYADRAVAILDSWTNLTAFTAGSDQDRLQAGWIGAVFAPAAEIMRGYPGYTTNQIANLQAMFKRAFYPQLNTMSTWNGNVDLTQIDAIMAIAVFNEDKAEFNLGLQRLAVRDPDYFYLASDGTPPPIAGDGGNVMSFWSNPTAWINGLTQETCRDNGHHTQFALGSALHAAETAWHQGVDVYTPNTARFTAALELLASQFLTGSMSTCANNIPSTDRFDTWEVGYNHYHNRVGLGMTNTGQLILTQIRSNNNAVRAEWNLNYETLTHANLPAYTSPLGGALPPLLTGWTRQGNGALQFAFTNNSSASFTVLSSVNPALALTNWTIVGTPANNGSGVFRFTTLPAANATQLFYRVRSP